MIRMLAPLIGLSAFLAGPSASAWQDPNVAEALARPLLEPGQAVRETQEALERRVPKMPVVASAEGWQREAERLRTDILDRVVFRGDAAKWRTANCRVEWLDTIAGGPGYAIRKLRYEAIPGFWIPALLYLPDALDGKVPVVLNVNGHEPVGKAADYKQARCITQAKHGMIALNVEWVGMGQLRTEGNAHGLLNAIDLTGTSGIALHYLAMSRALDLLLALPEADPARVALAGLSGGGWQTIFFSALDTRVTLANPVAGYSSFATRIRYLSDLGDSEQTPCDLAMIADYTHLTALRAPRPTLLTYNLKDNCCFAAPHALPPLLDAAWPIYERLGMPGNLRVHINEDPGTHNFLADNRQAHYRMLGDHFFPGKAHRGESIAEGEIQTAEALDVPLPDDNLDLHKIAVGIARDRPRPVAGTPEERRRRLRDVVRIPDVLEVRADPNAGPNRIEKDGVTITHHRLVTDEGWTVPAVEFRRGEPDETVLLIADGGRASAESRTRAETLLREGKRLIALDPFYFGEARPKDHDYLWPLLLESLGSRTIGLQAAQVGALARWARRNAGDRITVVAEGPRTSTIALVAAALDAESIDALELHDSRASLREWIDDQVIYNAAPEQFCFGLLAEFDITGLKALVAPRPIRLGEDPRR